MEERGIILTHNLKLNDVGGVTWTESLTPEELRKHLLYFDFVDFPRSVQMHTNLKTSEENIILIEQDFIRQTDIFSITHPGVIMADFQNLGRDSIIGQFDVLKYYAEKDVRCIVSQNNIDPNLITLYLPTSIQEEKKKQVIEMDLQNCLPIPSLETNIIDILEFKHKRHEELMAFREAMDNLSNLAGTDPGNLEDLSAVKILEARIADIDKTLEERKFNIARTSKKILINVPGAIKSEMKSYLENGMLSYAMFTSSPTKVVEALAVRGTKALIKAVAKEVFAPKDLPVNIQDYAYLYYAKKDV